METIGQILRRYREEHRLSLEKFEEIIKVPRKFLEKMEADDFKGLPGDYATRNYLKLYARYLNLDYKKLERVYDQQVNHLPLPASASSPKTSFKNKVYLTPRIIKIFLAILSILIMLGYLVWQIQQSYAAPELNITSPDKDIQIYQSYYEVKGKASPESQVFVNDREIFPDRDGEFSLTLDLKTGVNIIKFMAKKKHSKENLQFRKIIVE